jgi:hypothetical protein
VNVTITSASLPAFSGGTVQQGTYVLESETIYAPGYPFTGQMVESVQETIQISGSSFERATNVSNTGPGGVLVGLGMSPGSSTSTGTFVISPVGSAYRVSNSCPSTGTTTGSYTATPTTLTIEQPLRVDAGITAYIVANYTLQ